MNRTFFATCAPGAEAALHAEVRALRLSRSERQVGGVRFSGNEIDMWRANLWLRTAIRVLWRQSQFTATDADGLYRGVDAVDWTQLLSPDATFVVDAQSRESALDHTRFVEQRTKDAIADQMRQRLGTRPSIDKTDPDLRVHVHLFRDRATLSLDTSGNSLHKRGWRRYQGRAPLSETSAAALVMLSGWDRRSPLLDPFCGSGTILIEAALWASNTAPGLFRSGFGFQRWPGHDAAAFAATVERTRAQATPSKAILRGGELWSEHVEGARDNLAAADLEDAIELEVADARAFAPRRGWNGWIVTNPPFGARVGKPEKLLALYQSFGETLREHCSGYHVAVLGGTPQLLDALAFEAAERHPLVHGGLSCQVLQLRLP